MEMRLLDSGRRRPWVLYIAILLGAVLVGLLMYGAGERPWSNAEANSATRESHTGDSVAAAVAVDAFAAFTTQRRATRDATVDHAYTAEGLQRLAAVLYSIRRRESALGPPRYADVSAELLEAAAAIQLDERATHADIVRAAAVRASGAIADIQRARYPSLGDAVTELRHAAKSIRPDRELLVQTDVVQSFFDRASDVLRGMVEVGL